MNLPSTLTPPLPPFHPPAASETRLHGRVPVLLRVGWVAIVLFELAVFLASIPVAYAQLRGICPPPPLRGCEKAPTPGNVLALHRLGLSPELYALGLLLLALAVALLFIVLGAVIFWRKSAERLGLVVSLWLILFGASTIADSQIGTQALAQMPQVVQLVFYYLEGAIWPGLILFLCLFPDGRFVPRWAWLWVIPALVTVVLPSDSPLQPPNWPLPLFVAAEVLLLGSPVGFQVYRYLRISDAASRQQTKWFVFGVATGVLSALILHSLGGVFPPDSPFDLLVNVTALLVFFPIPLAISIAILRYRLWDIDTIINKALVYGTLTTLLAGVYAGLIIGLEHLAGLLTGQSSDQPVALVISTLAIAALFLPVRQRIQRLIDRRFYRRKYDAEKTLAAFSATLRNEVDLEPVLARLLAVVYETMQPVRVSLWLRAPERRQAQPEAWRRSGAPAGTSSARPPGPVSAEDHQESAERDPS